MSIFLFRKYKKKTEMSGNTDNNNNNNKPRLGKIKADQVVIQGRENAEGNAGNDWYLQTSRDYVGSEETSALHIGVRRNKDNKLSKEAAMVITASNDDNTETGDVAQNMESAVSNMEINASMTMNNELKFVNSNNTTTTTFSGDKEGKVGPVVNFKDEKGQSIPRSCLMTEDLPSEHDFKLLEWRNNVLKPNEDGTPGELRFENCRESFLGRASYNYLTGYQSGTYSGVTAEKITMFSRWNMDTYSNENSDNYYIQPSIESKAAYDAAYNELISFTPVTLQTLEAKKNEYYKLKEDVPSEIEVLNDGTSPQGFSFTNSEDENLKFIKTKFRIDVNSTASSNLESSPVQEQQFFDVTSGYDNRPFTDFSWFDNFFNWYMMSSTDESGNPTFANPSSNPSDPDTGFFTFHNKVMAMNSWIFYYSGDAGNYEFTADEYGAGYQYITDTDAPFFKFLNDFASMLLDQYVSTNSMTGYDASEYENVYTELINYQASALNIDVWNSYNPVQTNTYNYNVWCSYYTHDSTNDTVSNISHQNVYEYNVIDENWNVLETRTPPQLEFNYTEESISEYLTNLQQFIRSKKFYDAEINIISLEQSRDYYQEQVDNGQTWAESQLQNVIEQLNALPTSEDEISQEDIDNTMYTVDYNNGEKYIPLRFKYTYKDENGNTSQENQYDIQIYQKATSVKEQVDLSIENTNIWGVGIDSNGIIPQQIYKCIEVVTNSPDGIPYQNSFDINLLQSLGLSNVMENVYFWNNQEEIHNKGSQSYTFNVESDIQNISFVRIPEDSSYIFTANFEESVKQQIDQYNHIRKLQIGDDVLLLDANTVSNHEFNRLTGKIQNITDTQIEVKVELFDDQATGENIGLYNVSSNFANDGFEKQVLKRTSYIVKNNTGFNLTDTGSYDDGYGIRRSIQSSWNYTNNKPNECYTMDASKLFELKNDTENNYKFGNNWNMKTIEESNITFTKVAFSELSFDENGVPTVGTPTEMDQLMLPPGPSKTWCFQGDGVFDLSTGLSNGSKFCITSAYADLSKYNNTGIVASNNYGYGDEMSFSISIVSQTGEMISPNIIQGDSNYSEELDLPAVIPEIDPETGAPKIDTETGEPIMINVQYKIEIADVWGDGNDGVLIHKCVNNSNNTPTEISTLDELKNELKSRPDVKFTSINLYPNSDIWNGNENAPGLPGSENTNSTYTVSYDSHDTEDQNGEEVVTNVYFKIKSINTSSWNSENPSKIADMDNYIQNIASINNTVAHTYLNSPTEEAINSLPQVVFDRYKFSPYAMNNYKQIFESIKKPKLDENGEQMMVENTTITADTIPFFPLWEDTELKITIKETKEVIDIKLNHVFDKNSEFYIPIGSINSSNWLNADQTLKDSSITNEREFVASLNNKDIYLSTPAQTQPAESMFFGEMSSGNHSIELNSSTCAGAAMSNCPIYENNWNHQQENMKLEMCATKRVRLADGCKKLASFEDRAWDKKYDWAISSSDNLYCINFDADGLPESVDESCLVIENKSWNEMNGKWNTIYLGPNQIATHVFTVFDMGSGESLSKGDESLQHAFMNVLAVFSFDVSQFAIQQNPATGEPMFIGEHPGFNYTNINTTYMQKDEDGSQGRTLLKITTRADEDYSNTESNLKNKSIEEFNNTYAEPNCFQLQTGSNGSCSATHIGGGYFISANHCVEDQSDEDKDKIHIVSNVMNNKRVTYALKLIGECVEYDMCYLRIDVNETRTLNQGQGVYNSNEINKAINNLLNTDTEYDFNKNLAKGAKMMDSSSSEGLKIGETVLTNGHGRLEESTYDLAKVLLPIHQQGSYADTSYYSFVGTNIEGGVSGSSQFKIDGVDQGRLTSTVFGNEAEFIYLQPPHDSQKIRLKTPKSVNFPTHYHKSSFSDLVFRGSYTTAVNGNVPTQHYSEPFMGVDFGDSAAYRLPSSYSSSSWNTNNVGGVRVVPPEEATYYTDADGNETPYSYTIDEDGNVIDNTLNVDDAYQNGSYFSYNSEGTYTGSLFYIFIRSIRFQDYDDNWGPSFEVGPELNTYAIDILINNSLRAGMKKVEFTIMNLQDPNNANGYDKTLVCDLDLNSAKNYREFRYQRVNRNSGSSVVTGLVKSDKKNKDDENRRRIMKNMKNKELRTKKLTYSDKEFNKKSKIIKEDKNLSVTEKTEEMRKLSNKVKSKYSKK